MVRIAIFGSSLMLSPACKGLSIVGIRDLDPQASNPPPANGRRARTRPASAAAEFVADPQHVQTDHETKRLRIFQIFQWYEGDFIAELTRRGLPPQRRTLAAYVRLVAGSTRRKELEQAKDYPTEFIPYDRGINAQE